MLAGVRLRKLTSSLDEQLGNYALTKETLERAIKVSLQIFLSKLSGNYIKLWSGGVQ